MREFLQDKLTSFKNLLSTFLPLQTQCALLLLRHCGINRLNHLWRTVPSSIAAPTAKRADDTIWTTSTKAILDVPSEAEAERLQFKLTRARTASTLPLSKGGAWHD